MCAGWGIVSTGDFMPLVPRQSRWVALVFLPLLLLPLVLLPLLVAEGDIDSRFDAAVYTETVAGDLSGALSQYSAILAHAGADRSISARLLYRMAQCEERLGRRDSARLHYARLVKDYPDQADIAARAKAGLAALTVSSQGPRNLDFERGAQGWTVPSTGRIELPREGCRNRIGCAILTGGAMQRFNAAAYRGKTVRVGAWLKFSEPGERLQLRLGVERTDGHKAVVDEADVRAASPGEWSRCEVAGEIDGDAQWIEFGVLPSGHSRVWLDGVSFQVVPEREINAAKNAIEKAYARYDAAYLNGDGNTIELAHKTTVDSIWLAGGGAVVKARAEYVRSEANRTRSTSYVAMHRDRWVYSGTEWNLRESRVLTTRQVDSTTDAQTAKRAASDLKRTAAPLATIETGHTFYDLAPFGTAVGDARIVALGEATYGTREFFEIKHRLFEYLVREKGFSVFAINANWPEATALDLYIKSGEGDPRAVLASMLWPWNTREALDVVEWMREFNEAPGNHAALSFASFGISAASIVTPRVVDYLKRFSPLDAVDAQTNYAPLLEMESRLGEVYDDAASKAAERAEAVVRLLDAKRETLIQASSAGAWREARQDAELARQSAAMRMAGRGAAYGNQMMARNIEWLANDAYPGEKILLWGHNERLGFTPGDTDKSLGSWLREEFAERIYVTGFAVHRGELLAIGVQNGQSSNVAKQTIPDFAEGNGDTVLSAAGMAVFFLDLRTVPATSALGRWLLEPHSFLEVGALWNQDDPQSNWRVKAMSKSYDGLVFLEEGHAARGL